MNKEVGIWVSIIGLAIGLAASMIKAATSYGALEQQVQHSAMERADLKSRIEAVEKQDLDIAVLKETVRNMDLKLAEIKAILQQRN